MFAPDLLHDRVIVITGGGSGLGAEMARRFADLGAVPVVLGRRRDRIDGVAGEIVARGGQAAAFACDVRDAERVEAIADQVVARFGRVDALVNNAAGNFLATTEDLSPSGFKAIVDIVLAGTFHCTLFFGRKMIARGGGGAMVNIVTTYAWTGSAFVVPSAAAKAGVLAMTRSLAVEWACYGIRLNAIAPGPVPTEGAFSRLLPGAALEETARNRIPLKRFGTPREIADAAAYLLSDGAGYVTGECLTVDGGEWLRNGGEFSWGTDYDREELRRLFGQMRSATRPPRR